MRNKSQITDSSLDEMLSRYCKRKPQYVFIFKREEKTVKKNKFLKYAAASICAIALICGGVYAAKYTANQDWGAHKTEHGFFVTAYAAEAGSGDNEGKRIEDVQTVINKYMPMVTKTYDKVKYDSNGMIVCEDNLLEDGENYSESTIVCLAFQRVGLEMTGEDIVSFDVSADNGDFNYLNMDAYNKYHNSEGTNADKYFKKGKSIAGIPFDSENPRDSIVYWYPTDEKLDRDVMTAVGTSTAEYGSLENDAKISSEKDRLLKTAEDFTKYFGAAIKVTVHYENGTSETAQITISFDENGKAYASMS